MAILIITNKASSAPVREALRVNDPRFQELGRRRLLLGTAAAREYMEYFGDGWSDALARIEVQGTGVVYEGCTADGNSSRMTIGYLTRS
jgi:hypothetical protein